MESDKFCLKWNDFESSISSAFRDLRVEKDFLDVTLCCDNEQIQAHKVILSACSPFFRDILRRNPHQHPLLYLKGVRFSDLQSVLNFMYHGEVNVSQDELNSFLAVAEDLKVKGLTQSDSEYANRESHSVPKTFKAGKRDVIQPLKHPKPVNSSISYDNYIQEVVPVKTEPKDTPTLPVDPIAPQFHPPEPHSEALATFDEQLVEHQAETYDDYDVEYSGDQLSYASGVAEGSQGWSTGLSEIDQHIETLFQKQSDGGYHCLSCSYTSIKKSNIKKHVETHIETPGYQCTFCFKQCKTKNSLHAHTSVYHREEKKNLTS